MRRTLIIITLTALTALAVAGCSRSEPARGDAAADSAPADDGVGGAGATRDTTTTSPKTSENPKSRAGKLIKEARDAKVPVELREKSIDSAVKGSGGK